MVISQRSRQEMVIVPPCGTFCTGLRVTLCHLEGHFVLDCMLHRAAFWGIVYWTVCLSVPPDVVWIMIMLFADDVLLASYCVAGLQRQIDVLKYFADFFMIVNMSKAKINVFRKGRFLAANEVSLYGDRGCK